MKTADLLLANLAKQGGTIVSTDSLTELQITNARMAGNMYVDENGYGYVHLPNTTFVNKGSNTDDLLKQVELLQLKLSCAPKVNGSVRYPEINPKPLKARCGRE